MSTSILYGSETGCAADAAHRIATELSLRRIAVSLATMDAFAGLDASPSQLHRALFSKSAVSSPSESSHGTSHLYIFVCSTTGQGEVPRNMKTFFRSLLRRSLTSDCLSSISFAVLGLGDSGYALFNAAAKKLHRRLEQLGASSIMRRGDADDQHPQGVDGELIPWLQELIAIWPPANAASLGTSLISESTEALPEPSYIITPSTPSSPSLPPPIEPAKPFSHFLSSSSSSSSSSSAPFECAIAECHRLTSSSHWQDVRHFEMTPTSPSHLPLKFLPGDALAILPRNPSQVISSVAKRLSLSLDSLVTITRNPSLHLHHIGGTTPDSVALSLPLDSPISLHHLFEQYLDLTKPPTRRFFHVMSFYCSNESERERMQYFASTEGATDLLNYSTKEKRTVADVLFEFSSCVPTLDRLLEVVPVLRPRYFSIASSPLVHPNRFHLTIACLDFTTPLGRKRTGLCTSFLRNIVDHQQQQSSPSSPSSSSASASASASSLSSFVAWIQPGSLRLPSDPSAPLLLIGPGTGCAPFRSFLQHRSHSASSASEGTAAATLGPCLTYLGFRNREHDFLYGNEWNDLLALSSHAHLRIAFSRDKIIDPSIREEGGVPAAPVASTKLTKTYVQHLMLLDAASIWEQVLSHPAGHVYVAGSSNKMPEDVFDTIIKICQSEGQMTKQEAETFVKKMELQKKYQVETWG